MYKLFLCFRYLTRKGIVIFPILAVWLCVSMLIVVYSIMTGFVDRVRDAGKELMGDVVIQSTLAAGFSHYDGLQKQLAKLPCVAATAPVISTYGIMNLPEYQTSAEVEVLGIKPALQSRVSSFGKSLFWQYRAPLDAAHDLRNAPFPVTGSQLVKYARVKLQAALEVFRRHELAIRKLKPIKGHGWIAAIEHHWHVIAREDYRQAEYHLNRVFRDLRFVQKLPPAAVIRSDAALRKELIPPAPTFEPPARARKDYPSLAAEPKYGCVVGIDIGLYTRDRFGHYHRPPGVRFSPVILTVVPITLSSTLASPQSHRFQIVDDSRTKVFTVDRHTVYAPFRVVQKMAFMQQQDLLSGGIRPARCSEIEIRVHDDQHQAAVNAARDQIAAAVRRYALKHPGMQSSGLTVMTWLQEQSQFIAAVDKERDLITFLLGMMSLVVIVVIFLIFFMIVRDKTRDIGIIKAIGGSEVGVGSIFVLYGLLISSAGTLMGVITGVLFVIHDNWIHDDILWRIFGITIWNRRVYIFSRIPDQVNPETVATIALLAIVAGLLGAIIPALIAASRDPVHALRYE